MSTTEPNWKIRGWCLGGCGVVLIAACSASSYAPSGTAGTGGAAAAASAPGGAGGSSASTPATGGKGGGPAVAGPAGSGGGASAGKPSSGSGSGGAMGAAGASGRDAGSAGAGSPDAGAGSGSLLNPAPGSKLFVGANFWNVDWEGQGDYFASGVDFATTTNPWRPELLADLAPYSALRFMDWNKTNDSNNPQAVWSTRKQKTAMQNEPVAFEWQIDLCNRTHKDYWVNVPHEADATYWPKLAQLIQDQLDPSLRVYVEFSNEVWNSSFPQHAYAASKAQSLGLSGSDAAAAYYVYASVRVYDAFEGVFGKGSPRLVKVLAGQASWTGPCDAHKAALMDAKINPNAQKPDVYAVAPYFSGTSISALMQSVGTTQTWIKDERTCAGAIGVPLVSYEGGSDSYSAPNNGCATLQHDSGMHDLYVSYLDGLSGAGLTGPFMQYTHTGACWGLKEKTTDSLASSPKYKGVLDWLAAHP